MTKEMKKEFTYNLKHINYSNIPPLVGEMMSLLKNHHYGSFKTDVNTAIIGCALEIENGNTDPLELKQGFEIHLMHDIGKLGMSSEFLDFSGRYTSEMFDEMKKHSEEGANLLEKLDFDVKVYNAVEFHHSNFDGSSYPGGEKEAAIPFHSRVIRIADSANTFLTKFCEKEGGSGVFEDLDKWTGNWYDPDLIASFNSLHNKVMDACKKLGVSDPSQTVYMERLVHLYSDSLPLTSVEEVEQHYSL
ncbi:HD domain-containing protein [Priestia megaterium]|uniref:HD-GYP domain-containing protein n=1 Tax=Priestia megaterium TaxID=1404 RepID=UPI002E1EE103|nr:HD domain-containing protein [Priestia megaterium]